MTGPLCVAFDAASNVYVATSNGVQKFNSAGGYLSQFGCCAYGITIDPTGDIYVSYIHASAIARFTSTGTLVTQWGGPNQDNAYHHARIDASRRYRVRGCMNSCEEFVMTLRAGFMHNEVWGTKATITVRALPKSRACKASMSFSIPSKCLAHRNASSAPMRFSLCQRIL